MSPGSPLFLLLLLLSPWVPTPPLCPASHVIHRLCSSHPECLPHAALLHSVLPSHQTLHRPISSKKFSWANPVGRDCSVLLGHSLFVVW